MAVVYRDMNLVRVPTPTAPTRRDPRQRRGRSGVDTACAPALPGRAGMAPGINLSPGSDDDGWIVPPPVTLTDGTRLQLYKDGEALHAALEAIRAARRRICLEVYIFANDDTSHAFA